MLAKRYGWTIEYIMSLTRRQVRLLTISAGDHERLPDDSSQDSETTDLTKPANKSDTVFNKQQLREVRKSVKGNVGHKSHIVEKYLGRKLDVKYKNPTNPVKSRSGQPNTEAPEDFMDLVKTSIGGGSGIKLSDKVKRKLFQKKRD